jgi:beta-glucosidase
MVSFILSAAALLASGYSQSSPAPAPTDYSTSTGLQACGKHWIGNGQETQRTPLVKGEGETIVAISSNIDDRTIHGSMHGHLQMLSKSAWLASCAAITESMEAIPENSKILNGILEDKLGFQGYVMSDWGATHSGVLAI